MKIINKIANTRLSLTLTLLYLAFTPLLTAAKPALKYSLRPDQTPVYAQNLKWDWAEIEKNGIYPVKGKDFPANFIWGVGTSAYQVEGDCTNSSYHGWTKTDDYKEPAGVACAHEKKYKEDINLMATQLGVGCYRFSIERSKVEPEPGTFDEKMLAHYAQVCDELIKKGIRPVIGLHHYSDPKWFIARGGFANKKNIPGFVHYCNQTFNALQQAYVNACNKYHPHASVEYLKTLEPLYLTFNSPSSYCANGYLMGVRPPGQKGNMQRMATALKNMLEAHVQVYQKLKKSEYGQLCQIGITHNIYQLDPANPINPIQRLKCYMANKLVNDPVLEFFATGVFKIAIPFDWMPVKAFEHFVDKRAPKSLDVIGLNNYCHGLMGTSESPCADPTELCTDNKRYSIYAEGMYRALTEVSERLAKKLNIPIIVTENGIATKDDAKHDLFNKRYLYAINRAISQGHNVCGYIRWSLLDNYEWGNYDQGFGVYHVDRTDKDQEGNLTLKRTLKPGAAYLVDTIAQHNALHKLTKDSAQEKQNSADDKNAKLDEKKDAQ